MNKIIALSFMVALLILNSCGSKEKNIIGKWSPDLNSIELTMGSGIPSDIKSEVEQEMSGLKSMQFFMDQVIIVYNYFRLFILFCFNNSIDYQ